MPIHIPTQESLMVNSMGTFRGTTQPGAKGVPGEKGDAGQKGERGDPVSQGACLINGPGYPQTSSLDPTNSLVVASCAGVSVCIIKCFSGPLDCCFKYTYSCNNFCPIDYSIDFEAS